MVSTAALLLVGILALPGVYNTELVAPIDVFDHVRFHSQPQPGMKVVVIAPTKAPIRTFEGVTVTPDYSLESAPRLDVLVIPSAEGNMSRDLEDTALIAQVKRRVAEASLVLTLCDGAFVLAATGALDGRHAAPHRILACPNGASQSPASGASPPTAADAKSSRAGWPRGEAASAGSPSSTRRGCRPRLRAS